MITIIAQTDIIASILPVFAEYQTDELRWVVVELVSVGVFPEALS